MSHKSIAMAGIIAVVFLLSNCYKVTTVDLTANAVLDKEISFSRDVIPIFEKSCALSGCHASGNLVPDLSAARAYDSLLQEDLINFEDPENSELYDWLTGKRAPAMPLGGPDPEINAVILTWLVQGAQNN